MELTNQKHNNIWTTHSRNTAKSNKENGNIYVQEHQSNDESRMERRQMVPGKKTTIRKNSTTNIGNMARKTQIMTIVTQTREKKTIHPKHCQDMVRPETNFSNDGKEARGTSNGARK